MTDRRLLWRALRRLRAVRYGYLIAAVFISGTVFVFAYRNNNLQAIKLRDAVLQTDKQNGDTEAALRSLRQYTYSHMNAGLAGNGTVYPPIQLKYRYDRLIATEKSRVDEANKTLYTQAQNYCEQQVTSRVTINRVPCIQEYLKSHNAVVAQPIPDALYKFDFVAPVWSPDLAGWSLLITAAGIFLLVVRYGTERWLRHLID